MQRRALTSATLALQYDNHHHQPIVPRPSISNPYSSSDSPRPFGVLAHRIRAGHEHRARLARRAKRERPAPFHPAVSHADRPPARHTNNRPSPRAVTGPTPRLLALGSAAVLSVYAAGFNRTRAIAESLDAQDTARRRPIASAPLQHGDAGTVVPAAANTAPRPDSPQSIGPEDITDSPRPRDRPLPAHQQSTCRLRRRQETAR